MNILEYIYWLSLAICFAVIFSYTQSDYYDREDRWAFLATVVMSLVPGLNTFLAGYAIWDRVK